VHIIVTVEDELNMLKLITSGQNRPRLRVLTLFSPPWGCYEEEHDKALTTEQISVST
jgi:hypothetical protein